MFTWNSRLRSKTKTETTRAMSADNVAVSDQAGEVARPASIRMVTSRQGQRAAPQGHHPSTAVQLTHEAHVLLS